MSLFPFPLQFNPPRRSNDVTARRSYAVNQTIGHDACMMMMAQHLIPSHLAALSWPSWTLLKAKVVLLDVLDIVWPLLIHVVDF